MVAAFGDFDEGCVRCGRAESRRGMVVEITREPDVEPLLVRPVGFENLGNSRYLAGADEEIDLRQLAR